MELVYTNDQCSGCNKCVRACPVLISNIATVQGKVSVDPLKAVSDMFHQHTESYVIGYITAAVFIRNL